MVVLHGINLPFKIGSAYVPVMQSKKEADCQPKFVAAFVFG